MNNYVNDKCPNCGAPITTEICPYCHNKTGLDTGNADMEYPVIDCKEASITYINTFFMLIFAVSGIFAGFVAPIITYINNPDNFITILLLCSIFALMGIVFLVMGLKQIIRYYKVKRKGKEIEATVYGYMDDNMIYNGIPMQIVKLLVHGNEGPRFILYQLGDTKKPYKINSKIKLLVYNDIFLIKKEDNYQF